MHGAGSSSSSTAVDDSRGSDQQGGAHVDRRNDSISGNVVADTVFGLLQGVCWAGTQLSQLELLGDQRKAATARQELQEQQRQLQQALQQAMQLLLQSAEAAGARPDIVTQLIRQPLVAAVFANTSSSSSSSSSSNNESGQKDVMSWLVVPENPAASKHRSEHMVALASDSLADLYPGVLAEWQVTQAAAAGMVGCGLLQQLQDFGEVLWSQLPQPYCCSNWGCSNLAGGSESKLCGKSSRCSRCKVAR
jgi:hypothetical protein